MPDLAELNLVIDSSQAQTATDRMKGMSSASKILEGDLSSLTSIALKLFGAFSAFEALKWAETLAAQTDRVTIAFESMTGSATKAHEMVSELEEFSRGTPIQFQGLEKETQFLLALGINADRAVPYVEALAKAAAALGGGEDKIERLGLAIGHMFSEGAVQAREMTLLARAGVNAWDILAKAIGTDVPGAMEAVRKRMVPSAQAVEAIMIGITNTFGKTSDKLADSIPGLWDRAINALNLGMRDLAKAFNEAFNVRGILADSLPLIRHYADTIVELIRAMGGLPPLNAQLRVGFESVVHWGPAVLGAAASFLSLNAALNLTVVSSRLLVGVFSLLAAHPIVTTLSALVGLLIYFKDTIVQVGDQSVSVGSIVKAVLEVTWERFKEGMVLIGQLFHELLEWLPKAASDSFNLLILSFKAMLASMGLDWGTLWTSFTLVARTAANYVIATLVSIGDTMATVSRRLYQSFSALTEISFNSKAEFAASFATATFALKQAMSPSSIADEVKNDWKANFGTDFIGLMGAIGKSGGMELLGGLTDALGKIPGLSLFEGSGQYLKDSVSDYIAEVKKRSIEVQNRAPSTQPSDATAALQNATIPHIDLMAPDKKGHESPEDRAKARLQDMIGDLDRELSLSHETTQEREIQLKIGEAIDILDKAGLAGQQQANDLIAQYSEKLRKVAEQRKELEKIKNIGDDIGNAFGSAFEAAITQAKSLREIVQGLAQDIEKSLIRNLVTQPLGNAISGGIQGILSSFFLPGGGAAAGAGKTVPFPVSTLPSYMGNVFDNGRAMRFANGGIVGSTTLFPMRDGGIGMMGENGPEGILPLGRTRDGSLGVKGGGGSKNYHITFNISTPNVDSFKRSERQLTSMMRDRMGD